MRPKKALMHPETFQHMAVMHTDALVTRAGQGDSAAQDQLVRQWHKRIYNFCYKFFYDHDLAIEVTQKTFITICQKLHALQDAGKFKSWLYTIAVNGCREEYRKNKSRRSVSLEEVMDGSTASGGWERSLSAHDNPEETFRRKELSEILHECLLELSEEQRTVVIMKEYEGLKFREIAEVLDISENTVKSRMYYALDGLRKILAHKKLDLNNIGYE